MRLAVVPDRSRIDLNARPPLPGLRLVVDDVRGTVDTAAEPARPSGGVGAAAGDAPGGAGGAGLRLWLRALVEPGAAAVAVPAWLAEDGEITADVAVSSAEGDHVEARVTVRAGAHTSVVAARGRWHDRGAAGGPGPAGGGTGPGGPGSAPDGGVEVVGTALVDLRSLGFGLPPLVTYAVHVRWRLVLVPSPVPAR